MSAWRRCSQKLVAWLWLALALLALARRCSALELRCALSAAAAAGCLAFFAFLFFACLPPAAAAATAACCLLPAAVSWHVVLLALSLGLGTLTAACRGCHARDAATADSSSSSGGGGGGASHFALLNFQFQL